MKLDLNIDIKLTNEQFDALGKIIKEHIDDRIQDLGKEMHEHIKKVVKAEVESLTGITLKDA